MVCFDYVKPRTVADLLEGLRLAGSEGAVLAGGTDLHIKIRLGLTAPRVLFDISELAACRHIAADGEMLRIGAAVSMTQIMISPEVQRMAPALVESVRQMSCRQIRNRATLGGNIVTASPAADAVPPLVAAQAKLALAGPEGYRVISLAEFLIAPGKTALRPHEVLTEVLIPAPGAHCRSHFVKVGRRKAQAISIINLAVQLNLEPGGVLHDVRIALGAVAATAMRARRAEESLEGQTPNATNLAEAAKLAADECRPISDVRATANGRKLLVEAWTLRLLQQLVDPGGMTAEGATS